MTTENAFLERARQYGALLIDELKNKPDIRNFKSAEWAGYESPLRTEFGLRGMNILEWIVYEAKKLNTKFDLPENDQYSFIVFADDLERAVDFHSLKGEAEKLPAYDPELFNVEFKDIFIVPALFPKIRAKPPVRPQPSPARPSGGGSGNNGGSGKPVARSGKGAHLTVISNDRPKEP